MDATVSDPSILTPRSIPSDVLDVGDDAENCFKNRKNIVADAAHIYDTFYGVKKRNQVKQTRDTLFSFNFVLHLFRS
jgi:hypothetical protein